MRITIRMDDITPDMDWAKFNRFKSILDAKGVRPLIGVVPDNKDKKLAIDPPREDFWQYVAALQQKGWIVAMHGFNHLYTTRDGGIFPIGDKSEFAGLPYHQQDEMIREGKRILRSNGITTAFFMAPSHSYDKNTLKALRMNGFNKITDGFGSGPYESEGIIFYPISISKARTIESRQDGIVTFVYHTNTMSDRDFDTFEKLFDRAQVVSFDEAFETDAQVRGLRGEAKEFLTAKAKYYAVRLKNRRR